LRPKSHSDPQREAFFGQTHSHTSGALDAYIIGNHVRLNVYRSSALLLILANSFHPTRSVHAASLKKNRRQRRR